MRVCTPSRVPVCLDLLTSLARSPFRSGPTPNVPQFCTSLCDSPDSSLSTRVGPFHTTLLHYTSSGLMLCRYVYCHRFVLCFFTLWPVPETSSYPMWPSSVSLIPLLTNPMFLLSQTSYPSPLTPYAHPSAIASLDPSDSEQAQSQTALGPIFIRLDTACCHRPPCRCDVTVYHYNLLHVCRTPNLPRRRLSFSLRVVTFAIGFASRFCQRVTICCLRPESRVPSWPVSVPFPGSSMSCYYPSGIENSAVYRYISYEMCSR
ncbi:hypothetical protein BV20DRAFT_694043 [Pilatotrama ljubarskyi]|nr:hypothetical protein BV20DRAFT_694043 [Pilatotrama ljubarskyi]